MCNTLNKLKNYNPVGFPSDCEHVQLSRGKSLYETLPLVCDNVTTYELSSEEVTGLSAVCKHKNNSFENNVKTICFQQCLALFLRFLKTREFGKK